ncbi:hypothetical protein GCM10010124_06380 [Pilimelia terevasa]|uniref:Peptidase S8/S53 domain-containing protein n=1 Tax=Pilimelia terevasa TaxID=53372 RepID=A0A8J3BKY7_9ACTN|nr:S8 family serine peptidase [Pilimelia terevasa]GGK16518.1 hypothetical protein GCM10010124_06380 [Pilimelia terevasa]
MFAPPTVVALLLGLAATPGTAAAATPAPQPYVANPKPAHTVLGPGDSRTAVRVKFAEGAPVRLRDGRLTGPADAPAVRAALAAGTVSRLFPQSEQELADLTAAARRRSGRVQADLDQYYRVALRPGTDPAAVLDALNALPVVEIAYPEPLPAPPPGAAAARPARPGTTAATPNFADRQRYALPGDGIDAAFARTVPGGTGRHVRVHDIEYGWHVNHEDLTKLTAPGAMVPQGRPSSSFESHGTAVMGELIANDNAFGVTGLVPDATPQLTNVGTTTGHNVAGAITTAARALRPGDVMLLEQQMNTCGGGYGPVEWEPATYDAIVAATSAGIAVVQAAGNGNQNLDAPCNGNPFPRGKPDSGAIIVGAGGAGAGQKCSPPRQKLGFSTYGRRIDVQAWGECVVTTGSGDLQGGADTVKYTARFSGTSSASPIVTGAAAALSSIARERGRTLRPTEIRDILRGTGQAQVGTGGQIGPLPDLRAAIARLQAILAAEGR